MFRCLLCLSVRSLQTIAVILGAVSRNMERLALKLLSTHILGIVANKLRASGAFQLILLLDDVFLIHGTKAR